MPAKGTPYRVRGPVAPRVGGPNKGTPGTIRGPRVGGPAPRVGGPSKGSPQQPQAMVQALDSRPINNQNIPTRKRMKGSPIQPGPRYGGY